MSTNTNSKITKVSVSRRIVEETGYTPETVRKYLRLIESEAFDRIAEAYQKHICQAIDSKIKAIDSLKNQ